MIKTNLTIVLDECKQMTCIMGQVAETMVSNKPDNNSTMVGDRKTCKQEQNSKMEEGLCEQVLLYDVHNDMHMDKFLNSLVSNRVSEYLNGNQDIQCDIFKQWHIQSNFNFGFIPLSDFIATTNGEQGVHI